MRACAGPDPRPTPWPESFVRDVYATVDAAAGRELARLAAEEGLVPSCRRGCSHCCGQHVVVSIAEAQALAAFIRREFSAEGLLALRERTARWHAWDNARLGAGIQSPDCPLLVEGACSVYPLRPLVCRTHFVSSAPHLCGLQPPPGAPLRPPSALASVVQASGPSARRLQTRIEACGLDFQRTRMLLPHWLAEEMGWDFPPGP